MGEQGEVKTLTALIGLAAFVGTLHTLLGPDHYLPFVALARAGRWSLLKTIAVTLACGLGHVLSSVILGLLGVLLGLTIGHLEWLDAVRAELAGWLLLSFGLVYCAWGIRRAFRARTHVHVHAHSDGTIHAHPHDHTDEHLHVHTEETARRMTPWILFTIFVFGPCEPLIPILMVPAATMSSGVVAAVAAVFGLCTLATMTALVTVGSLWASRLSLPRWERFTHAAAGLAITLCGLAVKLGW